MMTNDEITEHLLSNPGSLKDDVHEELSRLRQFHADIVLARHGWCKDECSWEADERYIRGHLPRPPEAQPQLWTLKSISHD